MTTFLVLLRDFKLRFFSKEHFMKLAVRFYIIQIKFRLNFYVFHT